MPMGHTCTRSEEEVAENIPHLDLQICVLRLIGEVGVACFSECIPESGCVVVCVFVSI